MSFPRGFLTMQGHSRTQRDARHSCLSPGTWGYLKFVGLAEARPLFNSLPQGSHLLPFITGTLPGSPSSVLEGVLVWAAQRITQITPRQDPALANEGVAQVTLLQSDKARGTDGAARVERKCHPPELLLLVNQLCFLTDAACLEK
ncbi:hypothetical protein H1C71_006726 [Ictidomys tridecemlineatus]|nr:hypothetical protein H1C71_006726 [Ictidomys tridecemlineatus]